MSTSHHPQTDGQTERMNRVLEEMLRHYCDPSQSDWDTHLEAAEFAVNNAYQESVRETPFFLNYRRHPKTPVHLKAGVRAGKGPAARKLVAGLKDAYARAKVWLQRANARHKQTTKVGPRRTFRLVSKFC